MSKADEAPAPVEQKPVQLDPSQALEWGEVFKEQQAKVDDEEPTDDPVQEDGGKDDTQPADDTDGDSTDDDTDDEEEVEQEEPTPPAPKLEDPGDYVANDYSFEVEIEGKKTTISTPEQAAEFADENADKFTAPQLLKFMRQTQKMETNLEHDEAEHKKLKDQFDEQDSKAKAEELFIQSTFNELQYLVGKGKLPKIEAKYLKADWRDPEIAKRPEVKAQIDLLNYMRDENTNREKAGIKPFTSIIDAYNEWQLEQQEDTEVEDKKKKAAARKAAGGRVAGTSPNPVNIAPKGVSVGRVFNLNDLDNL